MMKEGSNVSAAMVLYRSTRPGFDRPIRWALELSRRSFIEQAIGLEEWPELSKSLCLQSLPALKIPGELTALQDIDAMLYVAGLTALSPSDPEAAEHALLILKAATQIREAIKTGTEVPLPQPKEDSVLQVKSEIAATEHLIGLQQDDEGHVVNNRLTYADLWIAQVYFMMEDCDLPLENMAQIAPRMLRTYNLVMAIPSIRNSEHANLLKLQRPVLVYFNMPGFGECCRLALLLAGINFEDFRITRTQWYHEYKEQSMTSKIPYLELGPMGHRVYESRAIIAWALQQQPERLGIAHPEESIKGQQLASAWELVRLAVALGFHGDPADAKRRRREVVEGFMAEALATRESIWAASRHPNSPVGISVGKQLSWVDCYVAGDIEYFTTQGFVTKNEFYKKYPILATVHAKVYSHPDIAAYRACLSVKQNDPNFIADLFDHMVTVKKADFAPVAEC